MSLRVIRKKFGPGQNRNGIAPIEVSRIQITSGGDRAFERELLELFVADTQQRIVDLERHVVSNNADAVRRIAHTIKGASASIGAPILREAAYTLEREASIEDLSRAVERLAALRDALEAVTAFVNHYVNASD